MFGGISMVDKLDAMLRDGENMIKNALSMAALADVKASLLGKSGMLAEVMKEIPRLDASMRGEVGRAANNLKNSFNDLIEARREEISLKASEISSDFDLTVPGILPHGGALHPITQMCYDLNDTFRSMGFEIFEESDITSELYAFDNLNFPPDHPARESMDTYWLAGHDTGRGGERLCLRPHLTGASVRYMQTHKPPYRFVYPGRASAVRRRMPSMRGHFVSMRR